jgi:hypothetical protein
VALAHRWQAHRWQTSSQTNGAIGSIAKDATMGFFSRLFETDRPAQRPEPRGAPPPSADSQAIERYRYMIQTAPPETIEQAHEEAFAKLTPEQRRQLVAELAQAAPAQERAAIAATSPDDPRAMARVATRAEIRQPGVMERTLGASPGLGGSLLSSFAAGFVGSLVAQSFFSAIGGFGGDGDAAAGDEAAGDPAAGDDLAAGGDEMGAGEDFGDFDV